MSWCHLVKCRANRVKLDTFLTLRMPMDAQLVQQGPVLIPMITNATIARLGSTAGVDQSVCLVPQVNTV